MASTSKTPFKAAGVNALGPGVVIIGTAGTLAPGLTFGTGVGAGVTAGLGLTGGAAVTAGVAAAGAAGAVAIGTIVVAGVAINNGLNNPCNELGFDAYWRCVRRNFGF
ncbi:hypothetical protein E3A20_29660 [Planctomyces bekefii]|uniref:Uncharacterized protein n=1 Tax=Planctomyces bekefii TaxID=1653850 RepID=A0A5C6LZH9_9PLAN|nr:hypothetical protein E3A20_29660 [Planctomyces bekefii]